MVREMVFHLEGCFEEVFAGADRLAVGAESFFYWRVHSILSCFYNVHVNVVSISMCVVHVGFGEDVIITVSDANIIPKISMIRDHTYVMVLSMYVVHGCQGCDVIVKLIDDGIIPKILENPKGLKKLMKK